MEAENKLLPWRVQTLEFLWQDPMAIYGNGKGDLKQEVWIAQTCGLRVIEISASLWKWYLVVGTLQFC